MAQSCWKCGAPTTPPPSPAPYVPPALDLKALLTSNDVPLEAETPVVQKAISEGQSRVDVLDAQIDDAQRTLARLIERRAEAVEVVRQHWSILSALRRVPPDVICEIFTLVSSGTARKYDSGMEMKTPPWIVGHICRSWRHLALSYPLFWSSIDISPYSRLPILETQLHRSANAPLDIYWSDTYSDADPHCLDLISAQCSRWRSLHFMSLSAGNATVDRLNQVKDRFLQLEAVELHEYTGTQITNVFASAPRLRKVVLWEPRFGLHSPHLIFFPWGQITHYRVACVQASHLQILQMTPNLTHCALGFSRSDDATTPGETQGALLPLLHRLILYQDQLLVHLTTPALRDLSLINPALNTLPAFLLHSSCHLTKLVLLRFTLSLKLIPILQALPTLTYLLIGATEGELELHADILRAMTISGVPSDICPNLDSLLYGYPRRHDFPADTFFSMAKSRIQSHCQRRLWLLRLFSHYGRLPSEDQKTRLQNLCDQGLDAAFLAHGSGEWERALNSVEDDF
ncbi:hypothetical protein B0H11DRAFT_2103131 [Mycena galericulata]|nr:hypothetical protein B0H11DRAFT_2103131 [Mycena galericulata]